MPTSKTRLELDNLLRAHGAENVGMAVGSDYATLMFTMSDRTVHFRLNMPVGTERSITHTEQGRERKAPARHAALDAEHRRLWRALLLVVKSKLEAAESGIETFEDAFLANIVLPDGSTVAENVRPAIESAYSTGQVRPLLSLTR